MKKIDTVRLVLALFAVGFMLWGIRTNAQMFQWAGIGCLAIAVVLRFFGGTRRGQR